MAAQIALRRQQQQEDETHNELEELPLGGGPAGGLGGGPGGGPSNSSTDSNQTNAQPKSAKSRDKAQDVIDVDSDSEDDDDMDSNSFSNPNSNSSDSTGMSTICWHTYCNQNMNLMIEYIVQYMQIFVRFWFRIGWKSDPKKSGETEEAFGEKGFSSQ